MHCGLPQSFLLLFNPVSALCWLVIYLIHLHFTLHLTLRWIQDEFTQFLKVSVSGECRPFYTILYLYGDLALLKAACIRVQSLFVCVSVFIPELFIVRSKRIRLYTSINPSIYMYTRTHNCRSSYSQNCKDEGLRLQGLGCCCCPTELQ